MNDQQSRRGGSPASRAGTDPAWIRAGDLGDVPIREGRVLRVGILEIAIFNLGDRVVAVENRCPHKGGPLADGIVAGHSVVCPLHAWKVNLDSGAVERPSGWTACVVRYDARIENGAIWVSLASSRTSAREGHAA